MSTNQELIAQAVAWFDKEVSRDNIKISLPKTVDSEVIVREAEKVIAARRTAVAVMEPPPSTATAFETRALPLIERGVPVVPVRGKIAFISKWENIATTDRSQVEQWGQSYPDLNVASVAKAQPGGVWFFEVDRAGLVEQIERETGQKLPDTFMVRSSPGRGHFYFRQSDASIRMGNRQAADQQGELWSARVDNRYVVGPGSIHPETHKRYEVLNAAPIVEAPQWLVDYCIQNDKKTETKAKTGHAELDAEEPIAEGGRNNALTSLLGKARQVLKMDREQLYEYGLSVNRKRCSPPLPDSEVRTISDSVGGYAVKETGGIKFEQAPATEIEVPQLEQFKYPVFPAWIMKGCSMYDGYIKPLCDQNSRYPEMMFVPGMAILLNYLGTKLHVGLGKIDGAMVNIIGRKGRVMKSSSVNDMFAYYGYVGIVDQHNAGLRNAEGKSIVWTAGSTEGVGVSAQRANCKNMILYFDELKTLSDKAGIEGSSMGGHLLTMLQSGKFANETKSPKGNFSFNPGEYSASVITCCTDRMFTKYWSKLIAFSDGLEDRTTLILQPEQLKDIEPRVPFAPTTEQIAREKQLVMNAVNQKHFEVEDDFGLLADLGKKHGPRSMARAAEWAIGFAVQLGKTVADGGCVERGIALEKYNIEVKRYLNVREAETREAVLQNQIVQALMQNRGRITLRDLHKRLHPDRVGTFMWARCYGGLIQTGITVEQGTGKPGDPRSLVLLQVPERDDD